MKDFVALCLNKEPKARPSVRELLEHPFFKGATKTEAIENLARKKCALNQLKFESDIASLEGRGMTRVLSSDSGWDFTMKTIASQSSIVSFVSLGSTSSHGIGSSRDIRDDVTLVRPARTSTNNFSLGTNSPVYSPGPYRYAASPNPNRDNATSPTVAYGDVSPGNFQNAVLRYRPLSSHSLSNLGLPDQNKSGNLSQRFSKLPKTRSLFPDEGSDANDVVEGGVYIEDESATQKEAAVIPPSINFPLSSINSSTASMHNVDSSSSSPSTSSVTPSPKLSIPSSSLEPQVATSVPATSIEANTTSSETSPFLSGEANQEQQRHSHPNFTGGEGLAPFETVLDVLRRHQNAGGPKVIPYSTLFETIIRPTLQRVSDEASRSISTQPHSFNTSNEGAWAASGNQETMSLAELELERRARVHDVITVLVGSMTALDLLTGGKLSSEFAVTLADLLMDELPPDIKDEKHE